MGLIEKINEGNWKDFAAEIARAEYPLGSLVMWQNFYRGGFGIVRSISKKGTVTCIGGYLPTVRYKENNVRLISYHKLNIQDFIKEEEDGKEKIFRARPFWYKEAGKIDWSIFIPKPDKKGLVKTSVHLID